MSEWWLFDIDDSLIERIKNKDNKAIEDFYCRNEKLLSRIVTHVRRMRWENARVWQNEHFYNYYDMMYQIYADIPYYNYENSHKLYYSIVNSCMYIDVGGYCGKRSNALAIVSFDKKLREYDSETTYGDIYPSPDTVESMLEKPTTAMLYAFEKAFEKVAKKIYPKDKAKQEDLLRRI